MSPSPVIVPLSSIHTTADCNGGPDIILPASPVPVLESFAVIAESDLRLGQTVGAPGVQRFAASGRQALARSELIATTYVKLAQYLKSPDKGLPPPYPWPKACELFADLDRARAETDVWILLGASETDDADFRKAADEIRAGVKYYHSHESYLRAVRVLRQNPRYLRHPLVRKGDAAFEKLVLHNLRFVYKIASKRKVRRSLSIQDAFQFGVAGLIRAVMRFQLERGFRFTTMAVWWIIDAVLEGANRHEDFLSTRVERKDQDWLLKHDKAANYLRSKLRREPTLAEIALELAADVQELQSLLAANSVQFTLDAPIGFGTSRNGRMQRHVERLVEEGPSAEAQFLAIDDKTELRERVLAALGQLSEPLRLAVWHYFNFDDPEKEEATSSNEIAVLLGTSGQAVRQNKKRALELLAKILA